MNINNIKKMLNPFSCFCISEQKLNSNLLSIFKDYQLIEYYLKWIYSYMCRGNPDKNFNYVKDKTLGVVISLLKKLDNSDNNPRFSIDDYSYLKKMTKIRNYYIHNFFIDYLYVEHNDNYDDCKNLYDLLIQDRNEIHKMYKNIFEIYDKIAE